MRALHLVHLAFVVAILIYASGVDGVRFGVKKPDSWGLEVCGDFGGEKSGFQGSERGRQWVAFAQA